MHTYLSKCLFINVSSYEQTEAFDYKQLLNFMHSAQLSNIGCSAGDIDTVAYYTTN